MRRVVLLSLWLSAGVSAPAQVDGVWQTLADGLLSASSEDVALWWTHATRKIMPAQAPPERACEVLRVSAARGEFEPVQLVVRPRSALKRLQATAGPLRGPGGATIPAERVEILRVQYVNVHTAQHPGGEIRGQIH